MKESENKWNKIDGLISKSTEPLDANGSEEELKNNEVRKAEWETFRDKYVEELDNTEKTVNKLNSQYGDIQRQFFPGKKKPKDKQ